MPSFSIAVTTNPVGWAGAANPDGVVPDAVAFPDDPPGPSARRR